MKRCLLLFYFLIIGVVSVQAQCQNCPSQGADSLSYCHTNSNWFEKRCASFTEGFRFVVFSSGKKSINMPLPQEGESIIQHLADIAKDPRYKKLKGLDLLFLNEAIAVWDTTKIDIGYSYTDSGLGIKLLSEGAGELPEKGKTVVVHYTGLLKDGSKFDSSVDRNQPFEFPLGTGRVIKGWDEGIALLKIGSKAMLRVPPKLGYGSRSAGKIPPNSTLYFEVELLEVK